MGSAMDEYRAFLREVIEVTRAATDAIEDSSDLNKEVRDILSKCAEELRHLREERQHQNMLQRETLRAKSADRAKSVEFCKQIVASPWFASSVPMALTWMAGALYWWFGIQSPQLPVQPAAPEQAVPEQGVSDAIESE